MWLDNANENFSNFHLVFMMRLSRFLGFFPNLDNYHEADYFDLREGRFVTMLPIHSDFLGIEEASKIALLMRLSYKTMHFCTFSRLERDRCAEVILYYYRLHIPNFPELKSLSVLKDLYNG
jgi:DNA repair protein RecO (recombination protein O)